MLEPGRAAVEAFDQRHHQLAIHQIETVGVDVEHLQRGSGDHRADHAGAPHFGVIAHPAQQSIGDARRAPRATGDLVGTFFLDDELLAAIRINRVYLL